MSAVVFRIFDVAYDIREIKKSQTNHGYYAQDELSTK